MNEDTLILEVDPLDIGVGVCLFIFILSLIILCCCVETCEDCDSSFVLKVFFWIFFGCGAVLGPVGYCLLQRPPEVSFIQCTSKVSNTVTISIKSAIVASPLLYFVFIDVILLTFSSAFALVCCEYKTLAFVSRYKKNHRSLACVCIVLIFICLNCLLLDSYTFYHHHGDIAMSMGKVSSVIANHTGISLILLSCFFFFICILRFIMYLLLKCWGDEEFEDDGILMMIALVITWCLSSLLVYSLYTLFLSLKTSTISYIETWWGNLYIVILIYLAIAVIEAIVWIDSSIRNNTVKAHYAYLNENSAKTTPYGLYFSLCVILLFTVPTTFLVHYGHTSAVNQYHTPLGAHTPVPRDEDTCGVFECDARQQLSVLSTVESLLPLPQVSPEKESANRLPQALPSNRPADGATHPKTHFQKPSDVSLSPFTSAKLPSTSSSHLTTSQTPLPQPTTNQPSSTFRCVKVERNKRYVMTLRDLTILHYLFDGEERTLRIIKKVAPRWKELARIFDFDEVLIAGSCNTGVNVLIDCCSAVFREWFQKGASRYPLTWNGLIKALKDLEQNRLVDYIEIALECMLIED